MSNPRPDGERLKPLSMRMPVSLLAWTIAEGQRRRIPQKTLLRDLLADARDCFGIPPLLRNRIAEAAREQRLSIRDYIAELLRDQRLPAGVDGNTTDRVGDVRGGPDARGARAGA